MTDIKKQLKEGKDATGASTGAAGASTKAAEAADGTKDAPKGSTEIEKGQALWKKDKKTEGQQEEETEEESSEEESSQQNDENVDGGALLAQKELGRPRGRPKKVVQVQQVKKKVVNEEEYEPGQEDSLRGKGRTWSLEEEKTLYDLFVAGRIYNKSGEWDHTIKIVDRHGKERTVRAIQRHIESSKYKMKRLFMQSA